MPLCPEGASGQEGRYVYCVARADKGERLAATGIEGREVYTVAYEGLSAFVHDCAARPYQSANAEEVAAWALAHHRVVDAAWKRWGAVLPLTFNTIIKAERGSSEESLVKWLATEYPALNERLESLAGKAEYGVQVLWDPLVFARKVTSANLEIRKLEEEVQSKPRGLAYMYRQKLEGLVRRATEAKAAEQCQALYRTVLRHADDVRVEKAGQGENGFQTLAKLSCLVSSERFGDLKAELEKFPATEGLSIRLAGPLPPYSFC